MKKHYWGMVKPEDNDHDSPKEPKVLEYEDNRIYFYSEIDRQQILTLNKALQSGINDRIIHQQRYSALSPEPLYLHLQSFGGSMFAGLSGMDQILSLRKKVPIITIVDGCCASSATFLSVVGTKRQITANSCVLVHQLSSGMWGKFSDLEDEMENMKLLMGKIKEIYKQHTKIPSKRIDEILKHNLWFDAKKSLEYGIVDEII